MAKKAKTPKIEDVDFEEITNKSKGTLDDKGEPKKTEKTEKNDKSNIEFDWAEIEKRVGNVDNSDFTISDVPDNGENVKETQENTENQPKKRGRKKGSTNKTGIEGKYKVKGLFLLFAIDLLFPPFFKFIDKFAFGANGKIAEYKLETETQTDLIPLADAIAGKYAAFLNLEFVFVFSLFVAYGSKLGKHQKVK